MTFCDRSMSSFSWEKYPIFTVWPVSYTHLDHVISELSQGMTLKAGTIISMGTPSGVGMGFDPPKFLKPGDVVECRIEGIGSLKNPVE